jgi:GAF domain-containing protein
MKKTVVILHKSEQEASTLVAALADLGIRGVLHCDPRGVIAALNQHKPDYVAIEMDQPLVDGARMCKLIRSDAQTRQLPIVLLTRENQVALQQVSVDFGAQGVAVGASPTLLAQDILVLMEKRRPLLLPNERQRMNTLRSLNILDTPTDPILHELTLAASVLTGTPIAVVSLVDERRQWFKSSIGLDVAETPREAAFCAHAIWGNDILEVADATKDIRFAQNPLVTADPHIRFYAGAPLVTSDGCGVGTLCVIDRVPRALTTIQREVLTHLSKAVTLYLERGRTDAVKAPSPAISDSVTPISAMSPNPITDASRGSKDLGRSSLRTTGPIRLP